LGPEPVRTAILGRERQNPLQWYQKWGEFRGGRRSRRTEGEHPAAWRTGRRFSYGGDVGGGQERASSGRTRRLLNGGRTIKWTRLARRTRESAIKTDGNTDGHRRAVVIKQPRWEGLPRRTRESTVAFDGNVDRYGKAVVIRQPWWKGSFGRSRRRARVGSPR